jgi:aminopeptidase YwaD
MRTAFIQILLCLLIAGPITAHAQDMVAVRKNIKILTSKKFAGRGPSKNGVNIAADFLTQQFKTIGLKPISNDFAQSFQYSTNTFQGKVSVLLEGKKLTVGKDFILHAASGSGNGKYKIYALDSAVFFNEDSLQHFLQKDWSQHVIAYPSKWQKLFYERNPDLIQKLHQSKGLILIESTKLTMTIAEQAYKIPCIHLLKSVYDLNHHEISFQIENTFIPSFTARNVLGMIEGTEVKDSFFCITAHYDHLGTLGRKKYFPGANDNASGVSMLIELAKYFKQHPLKYSIVFIAFAGEEAGLIGSQYFVQHPLIALPNIQFLVNLDLLGTGEEGIMVVNGTIYKQQVAKLEYINQQSNTLVKQIKTRGAAANSDHYPFYSKGVPSIFIYTLGGVAAYHDVYDIEKTLPLTAYSKVFKLLTQFFEQY